MTLYFCVIRNYVILIQQLWNILSPTANYIQKYISSGYSQDVRKQPLGICTHFLSPYPAFNGVFWYVYVVGCSEMAPKVVSTAEDIGTTTTSNKEIYNLVACQITDVWVRTAQCLAGIQPIVGTFCVRMPGDCVDVKSNLGTFLGIRL
jgi:hypothetical protein